MRRFGSSAMRADTPEPPDAVLTHHWLVRRRGGEKVLEAIAELVPDAPIYTLVHDPGWAGEAGSDVIDSRQIHHSPLQLIPGSIKSYPKLLPLMPLAARLTRLPPTDLVVCSDACLAKAMRAAPASRVVCYCHSPMRYVWDPDTNAQYLSVLPRVVRPLWRLLAPFLRWFDRRAASRVDEFIANSDTVAHRIQRCYGRRSTVVHPPIDLPAEPWLGEREDFYLCVGHHVTYKRLDVAIEACRRTSSRLVVIGDGPDVARLRPTAGPMVTFLGFQPDTVVHDHYRRAHALLFPGEEDFGIVPVEAIARGCPVIAFARGGALETVSPGVTGWHFDAQTAESLAGVMTATAAVELDPVRMFAEVQRFSHERFRAEMSEILRGSRHDQQSPR
jgi:glycosyltransferase involved in cell wall biosynthesis